MSLPERVLRAAAAMSAGLLRELGNATLPAPMRRTKVYQIMVESTLRFLAEQVGQVESVSQSEEKLAENFLIKRTIGDGIDLAGIAAFHASPVWILAALADISGTGRQLIVEITTSLKEEGLLDPDAHFENVDQLLDGLEKTTGQLATSIRFPPLDVPGLRKEWLALRESAHSLPALSLPSPHVLREQWDALKHEAAVQKRSILELSSLMALSSVRSLPGNLLWLSRCARTATVRTGQFFAEGLLEHYRSTLQQIHAVGYVAYWRKEFKPYLRAAAEQFSRAHTSLTERLLSKAR